MVCLRCISQARGLAGAHAGRHAGGRLAAHAAGCGCPGGVGCRGEPPLCPSTTGFVLEQKSGSCNECHVRSSAGLRKHEVQWKGKVHSWRGLHLHPPRHWPFLRIRVGLSIKCVSFPRCCKKQTNKQTKLPIIVAAPVFASHCRQKAGLHPCGKVACLITLCLACYQSSA